MERLLIARYGEIFLKGENRPYFERCLENNIKASLSGFSGIKYVKDVGRFYIYPGENCIDDIITQLKKVFGVVTVSPVTAIASNMDDIAAAAVAEMESVLSSVREDIRLAFKINTKRVDKSFTLDSVSISREIGGVLLEKFGDRIYVDVHTPEKVIDIEVRKNTSYVFSDKIPCPGGMPVGCTGKSLLLLSGGIDSPVAGYMAAKRGLGVDAIHFFSFPYTSERAKQKVVDLLSLLVPYIGKTRMFVVSLTNIQKQIRAKCPEEFMTILTRRFMVRLSNAIAEKYGYQALVTGENLGQVASQTIEGMTVTEAISKKPIIRPLICFDKTEIIDIAKKINTFDTSILPFEDCCTVFQPKHPVTKPTIEKTEEAESFLDCDALVAEAMENIEIIYPKANSI
ncbi:MAG: tRNA 4-thiouridine(8) synthase ThiI [Clostridiales bacterium]|nr:tRNA 4-thiouridine(8) synthase ThiI [Clostridiales bacterium]